MTLPKAVHVSEQNTAAYTALEAESLTDADLLTAYQRGENEAFAVLYRRHTRAVYQFVFYLSGDAQKADEVTQEVFVWLIDHPTTFHPTRGSFPAFLGGVARKLLHRQWRATRRWFSLEDAVHVLQAISLSRVSLFAADASLDASKVREAIALLPPRYREVVVLCDLQETAYAEAAQILNCSIGTVRSRLSRGRKLLTRKLQPSISQGDRHAL